jgi:hypothetical protein
MRAPLAAIAVPAALALAAVLVPAGSSGVPVTPNTGFQGRVNFSSNEAPLTVVGCTVGQATGHVKSDQWIGMFRDDGATLSGPRTGSGTTVTAYLDSDPIHTVTLTEFGADVPIPTYWEAPCAGEGYAHFDPSTGGIADTVHIWFTGVAS